MFLFVGCIFYCIKTKITIKKNTYNLLLAMLKAILLFIFTITSFIPFISYANIEKLDWVWTSCEWCNKDKDWNVNLYFNKFDWIYSNNYEFFQSEDLLKNYCSINTNNCSKNKYIKNQDWTILKTTDVEKYTIDETKNKFNKVSYSIKQINEIIQGIISPSPDKNNRNTYFNSLYNYSNSIKLSSFIKDNLNSLKLDMKSNWIDLDIVKGYRSIKLTESYSAFYFWTTIVVSDSNNDFFANNWYKYWFVSISDGCNRKFDDKNTYRWISIPLSVNYQKYKQDKKYKCIDEYLSDLSKREKITTIGVKDTTSILREPYRYTLGENFSDHFSYLENDFDVTLLKDSIPNIYGAVNNTNLETIITYEGYVDWKTFSKYIQFLKWIDKGKYYIIQGNRISFFIDAPIPKQKNTITEWEIKNNKWEIIHIDNDLKEGVDYMFCSTNSCDTNSLEWDFTSFKINDKITFIIKGNKYNYWKYYSFDDMKEISKEKDVYPFFYLPYVISSNWISLTNTITKENIDIVNLIYVSKDWTISKNIFKDKEWNILLYKNDISMKDILWDMEYDKINLIDNIDFTNFKDILNSSQIGMGVYGKINHWSYYTYLLSRKDDLISKTWIFKVLTKDFDNEFNGGNTSEKYIDMFVSLYNFKKDNWDILFLKDVQFYLVYNKEISKSIPIMCIIDECYFPEKWDETKMDNYFKRTFNSSKIEEFIKSDTNVEKMIFKMDKLEFIPQEYEYIKNNTVYIIGLPYMFKTYWNEIKILIWILLIMSWIIYYFKRKNKNDTI